MSEKAVCGISGMESLWVCDGELGRVRRISVVELGLEFTARRFKAFSLDRVTARIGLRDVLACREQTRPSCLVEVRLATGQSVVLAEGHSLLTCSDRGQVVDVLPQEARLGVVLRYLEVGPGSSVSPDSLAGILHETACVDPVKHTDYDWLRELTREAWGWDRFEGISPIVPAMLTQLRFEVVCRAGKIDLEKLVCYSASEAGASLTTPCSARVFHSISLLMISRLVDTSIA